MAKIKICGLRRTEDIEYVNELKPDFVGFILSPGFRRSIDFDTFKSLRRNLSDDISSVGVFVNEPLESIEKFTDSGLIDFVQLHGGESPQYAEQITLPVIKALKPCDFDKINEYKHCVDYFLFDSGTGTGKAFDWQKIPKTDMPFFLAGGLTTQNIPLALAKYFPDVVDLSSSVETNGVKDFNKIKEVINLVRSTTDE